MKRHKRIALAVALGMLMCTLWPQMATAAINGMVRVNLSSMGTVGSLALTINGDYGISGRPDIAVQRGQTYTVSLVGGQVTWDGAPMGSTFTLNRYVSTGGTAGGTISFYNTKYGTRNYLGDFTFSANGSGVRIVNRLPLEEYLYGVVPHEMSNSFPLEAQKAQAICARSYALKRMLSKGSAAYDLVDTSSDQVYKGYVASYQNSIAAVDATRGMVLTSGGGIIDAYYSSSNGGQTDLPGNLWTSTAQSGPYAMQDDPYDLANPSSLLARAYLNKDGSGLPTSMDTLLRTLAMYQINQQFYMADINRIGVVGIDSAAMTDPRAIDPKTVNSRFYTNMVFQVRMALTRWDGTVETVPMTLTASLQNQIKQALFPSDDLRLFSLVDAGNQYIIELRRWGHGVGMSQRGAQQMASSGWGYAQILSFYFPGAQQTFYDLTTTDNGANPGGTYIPPTDIAPTVAPTIAPVDPTPATPPAANPTAPPAGSAAMAYGVVEASSLTVRSGPGTEFSKVSTLKRGADVAVLDASIGGWYYISAGAIRGYVSSQYVRLTSATQPTGTYLPDANAPTGAPSGTLIDDPYGGGDTAALPDAGQTAVLPSTEGDTIVGLGMVKVPGGGTVNLRKGPGTSTERVISLGPGRLLDVYGRSGNWLSVAYNGTRGYISIDYVLLLEGDAKLVEPDKKEEAKATSSNTSGSSNASSSKRAKVKLSNANSTVTIREAAGTNYKSLGTLKHGDIVSVLDKGGEWTKIKFASVTGYIANQFLTFLESETAANPKPASIAVGSGNVNIRRSASDTSGILGSLPNGTKIDLLEKGDTWSKIRYENITGYVMNKFVK